MYTNRDFKNVMSTLCQSCEINKTLKASECELDCTQRCAVCMDCIPVKNQSVRTCGHMMCAGCDTMWRAKSYIVEKKCSKWSDKGKEEIFSVYMIDSECPMCRGKETPGSYMERSKVSLVHEIQCLLATLHKHKIRLGGYNVVDIDHMDSVVVPKPRVTPPTLQRRIGPIVTNRPVVIAGSGWEYVANPVNPARALLVSVAALNPAPIPVEDNYVPPIHAQPTVTVLPIHDDQPDPVRQEPVRERTPPQFIDGVRVRAGTCIRKYRNLGCTTVRTAMRCIMCNAVLCRECRNQCPCRGT